MKILFQCPCGKSMVAEGETAGTVVRCPNCNRQLRVPSGKERGKELASAPATPTMRICPRCRKNMPIDSQVCPHCKSPAVTPAAAPTQAAAPAAAPEAKKKKKKKPASPADLIAAAIHAPTVDEDGKPVASPIAFGGARHSGLSKNAQMGILFGAIGFALVVLIIGLFVWSSGSAKDLAEGRSKSSTALTEGRKLECSGKFQEAYELYCEAQNYKRFLEGTGIPSDADLVRQVDARALGLQYIVPNPKVYGGGMALVWKAESKQELDTALAEIQRKYPEYRGWILGVTQAGLEATAAGKGGKNKAIYEAKLGVTMDAFINFTSQASRVQRCMFSFMVVSEAIRDLTTAYRNWDLKDRDNILMGAEERFKEIKVMVGTPGRDTIRSN